jgi:hypothetical protein
MDSKRIQDIINSLIDKYATNETYEEVSEMVDYWINHLIDEWKEQEAYEQRDVEEE